MDFFDLNDLVLLMGVRVDPKGKPITSTKMVEFLRRATRTEPRK